MYGIRVSDVRRHSNEQLECHLFDVIHTDHTATQTGLARECSYDTKDRIVSKMRHNKFTTLAHTVTPHNLLPAFTGATDRLGTRPGVGTEMLNEPVLV